MKDTRHRTTLGNRFRFGVRFLGLTGLLALSIAGLALATEGPAVPLDSFGEAWLGARENVASALDGERGQGQHAAAIALIAGAVAAALWAAVEVVGALFLGTGRRSLTGSNAAVQVALAVALFSAVNVYSFSHYLLVDETRERQFTLPANVSEELRKVSAGAPTTIVVLQQHKTLGGFSDKQDSYETAAGAKVVEKVRDLVDQFREFGPRFKVVALDTTLKGYDQRLDDLTAAAPELRAAIAAAPEDSIFFSAGGRVQRLGFNEFYQLDKTGSKAANGGRGNLVLLPQGVEGFARRILAVQEKRPKVALAVIHEILTTEATDEGEEQYTAAGLRKALTEYGFDVVDVVLKKGWPEQPEAAAYTLSESKLERLEAELQSAEERLAEVRQELAVYAEARRQVDAVKAKPFAQRNALYRKLLGRPIELEQEARLLASLSRQAERATQLVPELEKERRAADDKVQATRKDERGIQNRRLTDVKAKFTKLLADVDLLVLPRMTVFNATTGSMIPPALYKMSKEQAEVVKDYMKSGRPVLACCGPIPARRAAGADPEASDDLERLLAERGVELGRQTILFDGESKAFSARRAGSQFGGGGPAEIPPLAFEESAENKDGAGPNPVGEALRLTARGVEQKLDLKLRALRPIYLGPGWRAKLPFAAEFVATSAEAWNEDKPFPETRPIGPGIEAVTYMPKFEAPPLDDPKRGTRDEERRGPFPVGVAVESKLPAYWYDSKFTPERVAAMAVDGTTLGGVAASAYAVEQSGRTEGPMCRLIVFGHGGLFSGPELKPTQQKLLLHSANWLLGRSDRLPHGDAKPWEYPRVNLSAGTFSLWHRATFAGLPLLMVYLGLVVLMVRKAR